MYSFFRPFIFIPQSTVKTFLYIFIFSRRSTKYLSLYLIRPFFIVFNDDAVQRWICIQARICVFCSWNCLHPNWAAIMALCWCYYAHIPYFQFQHQMCTEWLWQNTNDIQTLYLVCQSHMKLHMKCHKCKCGRWFDV